MSLSKLATAFIAVILLIPCAKASDTLNKIKESGTISLGVRDSSIPFSYIDDKQKYIGYSVDLCMKAATAIQKHLGLSSLNVKIVPATAATSIPLIANGTIDISCNSLINNLEREQQVAFSTTIYFVGNAFMSKKVANLKTLAGLKGKTVVSNSGTVNLKILATLNKERNLGMRIVTAKDLAEAFLMVETGRAAAFMTDDVLLVALVANSKTPQDYTVSSDSTPLGPYGLIIRRNDPEFKKVVDEAIFDTFKSGEINRIYAKWFQSPIPPKGINLNWPMSAELKKAIAHPTDSGNLADYK